MAFRSYKKGSKANWGLTDNTIDNPEDIKLTLDQINSGCLMRIADATELMAKNYQQMEKDLQWYKDMYRNRNEEIERLRRSVASYKGKATKYKNKLK